MLKGVKRKGNTKLRKLRTRRQSIFITTKLENKIGYWNSYLTSKCKFKLRRRPTDYFRAVSLAGDFTVRFEKCKYGMLEVKTDFKQHKNSEYDDPHIYGKAPEVRGGFEKD